jgi:hypothetical protein
VRRFLPLERLRASTFRPPGLELRFRNPCFLLPFRFLGWYVRFISSPTSQRGRSTLEPNTLLPARAPVKPILPSSSTPRTNLPPPPITSSNSLSLDHFRRFQKKVEAPHRKCLHDFGGPC